MTYLPIVQWLENKSSKLRSVQRKLNFVVSNNLGMEATNMQYIPMIYISHNGVTASNVT